MISECVSQVSLPQRGGQIISEITGQILSEIGGAVMGEIFNNEGECSAEADNGYIKILVESGN